MPLLPILGEAFTQERVQAMVRPGPGDQTGAKEIEQQGIDFVLLENFLPGLETAGANETLLSSPAPLFR
jgi:hypothetical protein